MDQEWEEIDDYYKEYGEFPLPKVNDSDLIGESGVYTVAGRVLDDIKWLFRDQPKFDTGVDAHIEVRDVMRNATGRLIGVQIKSGKSFFAQSKDKGHHFIFYGELKHYKYWLTQSLPIIITLVNPVNKECYWQYVKSDTVVEPSETGSVTFKIKIPKYQKLNEQCKELLETVALNQTMEQAKYNILKSVKYLIEELNKGNEIHLICTEKIFQSGLGKANIDIGIKEGNEIRLSTDWKFHFNRGDELPYSEIFRIYFSWCQVVVDEEVYKKKSKFQGLTTLIPYESNDAFRLYRFKLCNLNEMGKSFLILDRYLNS